MNPGSVCKLIQMNTKEKTVTKKAEVLTVEETVRKLITPKNKITRLILKYLVRKCRAAVRSREDTKSELIRCYYKLKVAFRELGKRMVSEGYIPQENLIFHLSCDEIKEVLTKRNPVLLFK